jgi:hypothetical protein
MTQASSSVAVNCVFGNSTFGGAPNPHTLYVTGDSGAFKIQLKVSGRVRSTATATARIDRRNHLHYSPASSFRQTRSYSGLNVSYPTTLEMFDLRGVRLTSGIITANRTVTLPRMSNLTAAVRTSTGEALCIPMVR